MNWHCNTISRRNSKSWLRPHTTKCKPIWYKEEHLFFSLNVIWQKKMLLLKNATWSYFFMFLMLELCCETITTFLFINLFLFLFRKTIVRPNFSHNESVPRTKWKKSFSEMRPFFLNRLLHRWLISAKSLVRERSGLPLLTCWFFLHFRLNFWAR